ncbi:hypothetical protein F5Y04DRAFT_288839 [Hypomontagnella monticulosa]|nr:hypothetical protein F5Y04DRAFT_288839 [Hypomontagnella monticulosa]
MCTLSSPEAIGPVTSEHITLAWPDDYVTLDSGSFIQEESSDQDSQDKKKRIIFRPQLAVNVYNTGGSNSSAGGSGSGAGGSGTGGAASVYGSGYADGSDDTISNFASQLAALTNKVDQLASLRAGPVIESGAWNTIDVRPWNQPEVSTQARINFIEKFTSVPTVAVSINAADVEKRTNFRVKAYATAVDVKGFTITAESWGDTVLFSCGVTWIAIGAR